MFSSLSKTSNACAPQPAAFVSAPSHRANGRLPRLEQLQNRQTSNATRYRAPTVSDCSSDEDDELRAPGSGCGNGAATSGPFRKLSGSLAGVHNGPGPSEPPRPPAAQRPAGQSDQDAHLDCEDDKEESLIAMLRAELPALKDVVSGIKSAAHIAGAAARVVALSLSPPLQAAYVDLFAWLERRDADTVRSVVVTEVLVLFTCALLIHQRGASPGYRINWPGWKGTYGSLQDRRKLLLDCLIQDPTVAECCFTTREGAQGLEFILQSLDGYPLAEVRRVGEGIAGLMGRNPSPERMYAAAYGWWDHRVVSPEQKRTMLAALLGPEAPAPLLDRIIKKRPGPLQDLVQAAQQINAALGEDVSLENIFAAVIAWEKQDIGPTVLKLQPETALAHVLNFLAHSGSLNLAMRGLSAYVCGNEYKEAGHHPGQYAVAFAREQDARKAVAEAETKMQAEVIAQTVLMIIYAKVLAGPQPDWARQFKDELDKMLSDPGKTPVTPASTVHERAFLDAQIGVLSQYRQRDDLFHTGMPPLLTQGNDDGAVVNASLQTQIMERRMAEANHRVERAASDLNQLRGIATQLGNAAEASRLQEQPSLAASGWMTRVKKLFTSADALLKFPTAAAHPVISKEPGSKNEVAHGAAHIKHDAFHDSNNELAGELSSEESDSPALGNFSASESDDTSEGTLSRAERRFILLADRAGIPGGLSAPVAQVANSNVFRRDGQTGGYLILRELAQQLTEAFALFKTENALPDNFLSDRKYIRQRASWYERSQALIKVVDQATALLRDRPEIKLPGIALPDTRPYTTSKVETRGSFLILHDQLRQLQNSGSGTMKLDGIFIPVAIDSPASEYVFQISGLLEYLKLSLKLGGDTPDMDGTHLAHVSNIGMKDLLRIHRSRFGRIDLQQPFHISLEARPTGTFNLKLTGTSARKEPVTVVLQDLEVRFLPGYAAKLDTITGSSPFRSLVIRDDLKVTLASKLDYYGINIPTTATQAEITRAIDELRPKAALIAGAGDRRPSFPPSSMLIDPVNLPNPTARTYDEGETSDYGAITREIKKLCDHAYDDCKREFAGQAHFGASSEQREQALLRGMQNGGGIVLKLGLEDTDGEDNTYHKQHAVNPKNAKTLKDYFDSAAQTLGDYMIRKIRDKDGEDEGAINIKSLALQLFSPHFVEQKYDLTDRYIKAFDMRSKDPPFLYLDPLSAEAYQVIQETFGEITAEFKAANGDVSQSKKFLQAVNRLLTQDGVSLSEMSEDQRKAKIAEASDQLLKVYYRVASKNIENLQRLLIAQQPSQAEFIGRAVCRHLGIDEFHWPVIAGKALTVSYKTGPANVGSFIRGEEFEIRTMLEIVYDPQLRKEVGLATNKDEVCASLAIALAKACQLPVDDPSLKRKMEDIFHASNVLDVASSADNDALPEEIIHPREAFIRANDQYIEKMSKAYRRLEAERIALTSDNALSLIAQVRRSNMRANPGESIDFEGVLDNDQKILLNARTERFKNFLKVQRNSDDFHALVPGWEQIAVQLKDMVVQICRNAPLQVCMAANLIDDIAEGADAGSLATDGLFFASSVLSGLKNVPLQRLGALTQEGANAWSLVQSVEAYRQAIKDKNYEAVNKNLLNILMSGHSLLASGAVLVENVHDRVTGRFGKDIADQAGGGNQNENVEINAHGDRAAEGDDWLPEEPGATAHEMDERNRYWTTDESGRLSENPIGREVLTSLWNGDVIVEGGARAIRLGDGAETVYMLGDTPCGAVRAPTGHLALWPIGAMDIQAGRWTKTPDVAGGRVAFSRLSGESGAFPRDFSGQAVRSQTSALNAVSWYDNRIVEFDGFTAEKKDAAGRSAGTGAVHIGVIEHKYVMEQDGEIDILEHAGSTSGKTTFIRNDGSSVVIDRELPKTPACKHQITARIVGAKGMFATVEVTEAVNGLTNRRTVGGVFATLKTGGQELVFELDSGLYCRGEIPAGSALHLAPGEVDPDRQPIEVKMRKIDSGADPKRASPALFRTHGDYRDSSISHDDFALELYFGARFANEAYAKDPEQVRKNKEIIAEIKSALPPEVRDTSNPYYVLTTTEADAILFAARNRAALAPTLVGKNVEWGGVSKPDDLGFVENLLRKIHVNAATGGNEGGESGSTTQLLAQNRALPSAADQRRSFHADLKAKIRQKNLLLAQVELKNGRKVHFISVSDPHASDVAVTGGGFGQRYDSDKTNLGLVVKGGNEQVRISSSGSIVDRVEAAYPDPSQIEKIRVFSLDQVSSGTASRIFVSSARGYRYTSVTSMEPLPSDGDFSSLPDKQYAERVRSLSIHPATVDLSRAVRVNEGAQNGAYAIGNDYYVLLDNKKIYRAEWDATCAGFRLIPPEGASAHAIDTLPLVQLVAGEFTLVNRPGLKAGSTISHINLKQLERDLQKDPTPPVLRTAGIEGENVVIVAPGARASHELMLDGTWVLTVNGKKYYRAIAEGDSVVYVRESADDVMETGCAERRRALEPLCVEGEGRYLVSKNVVKGADLPPEGTDRPDLEEWTPWASDVRVHGVTVIESRPAGGKKEVLAVAVPYEGKYKILTKVKRNRPEQPDEIPELKDSPAYTEECTVTVLRRQGHAAQIRIDQIDSNLPGSRLETGASIFKEKGIDTEWICTQYDGAWYFGSFDRSSGEPTPKSIRMVKVPGTELQNDKQKEMKRLHTGMQNANYHVKTLSPDELEATMKLNRHLGVSSPEFEPSEHFETSTTGEQAYLFDRATREHVQVKTRNKAGWDWLKLDDTSANPAVETAKQGFVDMARAIFDDPDIKSVHDLLALSADKKISLGAKNFLIYWINENEAYFSMSGKVREAQRPALFKDSATATIIVSGKEIRITNIDVDPNLETYMGELDAGEKYPRALPTAARPEDLEKPAAEFDVTVPRNSDTERKMIAYIEYGGRKSDAPAISSIRVFNRNDACKSCAAILQKHFEGKEEVIHVYGNEYKKY